MTKLNKLLISHIIVAFITISFFVYYYSKPFGIIVLHTVLISSLYYLTFSIARLISRLWRPAFRFIAPALFTLLTSTLLFIYTADFLSNAFWNSNISFTFAITYLSDLNNVLEEIPYAVETLAFFSALIVIVIYWLYKKHVTYLHDFDDQLILKDSKVYLFITAITPIYLYFSFTPTHPGIWDGEPLTSLALKTNIISYLNNTNETFTFGDNASDTVNTELKNIILIHADALRADHMSSYGYKRDTTPFISSLVRGGATQIEMGHSICSESICGMLAALGSQHIDSIQADTPLINTYLKRENYRIFFAGSGNYSWGPLDGIFSHDIDYFARADRDENFSIHDDSIILSAISKMQSYEGVPTFFFLRYMSSHPIGRHFSQYRKYTPSEKNLLTYIFPAFEDPDTLINAYDNYIFQLDDFVRKTVELLDEKGYLENSILVIYGDHGEALNEHGYFGHYHNLHQEEIHVPIIFMSTNNKTIQEKYFATLNDILPTVFELNGLAVPKTVEGISLLREPQDRITYHDSRTGVYGAMQKDGSSIYKFIYNSKNGEKSLFNLTHDPRELDNLHDNDAARTRTLLSKTKKHFNLE